MAKENWAADIVARAIDLLTFCTYAGLSSWIVLKIMQSNGALQGKLRGKVLHGKPGVHWRDIVGLPHAKQALKELIILPSRRPDLFKGLRAPAKGLLLYGPPGNGKTMLAKALACETQATFFNITAQSLTSKWYGEAEQTVRLLFRLAAENAPSIIFLDDVDSVLSHRGNEHQGETSLRLKTQFMADFDGVATSDKRVIVIAATNRPQDLDAAVRRRLAEKIYIPLPDEALRLSLLKMTLTTEAHPVGRHQGTVNSAISHVGPGLAEALHSDNSALQRIAVATEGYSCSDIKALCREAALVAIRELGDAVEETPEDCVRDICYRDFQQALSSIKPSVNIEQLLQLEAWTRQFGHSGN